MGKRRHRPFRSKKDSGEDPTTSPQASSLVEASAPSSSTQASGANQYGLHVVCEGTDPVIDIVAVHGINGHPEMTWTAVNGVHWLRDLLPQDLPGARVLTWGYDANTHSGSELSVQYLYDHSQTLVSDLCLERQLTETSKRPIIFVAHSLGGIIVKGALIHSSMARQGALEEHRAVKLSTYGIIFMGTPHQGGNGVTFARRIVGITSVFMKTNDRLLRNLEDGSEYLQQQLIQYGPISGDFVTKFAYETLETPTVLGTSMMIVPRTSAVVPGAADSEPIAIHADHTDMVKFMSKSDSGYKTVSGHLRIMAKRAGDAVGKKWEKEGELDALGSNRAMTSFVVQFGVPEVTQVERFVGRKEDLNTIWIELQYDGSRKIVVVHGLGGIGKTQLALAYAHLYRKVYSAVFWVNAKSEDTLKQGYAALIDRVYRAHPSLTHLKTVVEGSNLDDAVKAAQNWLSSAGNDRWLVIFDNYDTPKLPGHNEPGTFDIRPLLPQAHQGAVLITTRSSLLQLGCPVAMEKLQNIEDSLEILSQTSKRNGLATDPDARKLADELDGLPLALATAGAYLHTVSTSFAEYLQMYKASWSRLQQKTPRLLSYEDKTLYSTWNISLEHVKQQNELAVKLLQLWAYLDNQDVWLELLQSGREGIPEWFLELTADRLSFDEVLRVLSDHALIEVNPSSKATSTESRGYSMHSCVHAWTMHVVNKERDGRLAGLAVRCVGLHMPRSMTHQGWLILQRLSRHGNRCWDHFDFFPFGSVHDPCTVDALEGLFHLYAHSGMPQKSELWMRALDATEATFRPNHPLIFTITNYLSWLYENQGRLEKAEEMLTILLVKYFAKSGPNHLITLMTIKNLGDLYKKQGRLEEAEEMLKRARDGTEAALGPDHISSLYMASDLGIFYLEQGKREKAEEMLKRALDETEAALGPDHMSSLHMASNLGRFYLEQGELEKAEAMMKRSLDGEEAVFGPDHESTLGITIYMGLVYLGQGKLDDAIKMFERALTVCEKVFGSDHPRCENLRRTLVKLRERTES